MMNRFGVGRCCCNCEDCCNGSFSSNIEVDFSPSDDACSYCNESIGGTYILSKLPQSDLCEWTYGTTSFPDNGRCNPDTYTQCVPEPYTSDGFTGLTMGLSVKCASPSQYMVLFRYTLVRTYNEAMEYVRISGQDVEAVSQLGVYYDSIIYGQLYDISAFDCSGLDNFTLYRGGGFFSRQWGACSQYGGFNLEFGPQWYDYLNDGISLYEWKMKYICKPPDSVTLTSV